MLYNIYHAIILNFLFRDINRIQQAESELQLVTSDRDRLAQNISTDCELFENKILELRTQCKHDLMYKLRKATLSIG